MAWWNVCFRDMSLDMQESTRYGGVIVPILTPVTADGQLDVDAAIRLAERIIAAGASIFVLGTTGEAPSLDMQSRIRLVEAVLEVNAGRRPVFAGVSDNSIHTSIELAARFGGLGVDVVFAHVPSFFPLGDDEVIGYFEYLADRCPTPLLLYNIPSMTKTAISIHAINTLMQHERIVGIKDSQNDMDRLRQVVGVCKARKGFLHLTGCTALSLAGLALGSDGIVPGAGNLFPGLFRRLYEAARDGDMETAKAYQGLSDRIGAVLDRGNHMGQALAVLKAMAHLMGICGPHMLPPLRSLSQQQIEQLRPVLDSIRASIEQT